MGPTVLLAAGLLLTAAAAAVVVLFVADPHSGVWITFLSMAPWGPLLLLLWRAHRRAERLVARFHDSGLRGSATVDAITGTPWTVNERPTVRLDLTVTPPDGRTLYRTWTISGPQPSFAARLRPGVTLPILIDPRRSEAVLVDWEAWPGGLPDPAARLAMVWPSWPLLRPRPTWGWALVGIGLALAGVKAVTMLWSFGENAVPQALLVAGALAGWLGPIIALVGVLLLVTRYRAKLRQGRSDRLLRDGTPARATVARVQRVPWRGTRDGVAIRRLELAVQHNPDVIKRVTIIDAPPYHLETLPVEGAELPVRLDPTGAAAPTVDWPALEQETGELRR